MRALIIGFGLAVTLVAQPIQPKTSEFVVASLRRNADIAPAKNSETRSNVIFDHWALGALVARAYGVKPAQVTGPSWIRIESYNLAATLPPEATADDIPAMLRNLLVERLKLKVQEQEKPVDSYILTVANSLLKIKPLSAARVPSQSRTSFTTTRATIRGEMTIGRIAELLTPMMDKPVVDRTGLVDEFRFDIDAALAVSLDGTTNGLPSIFTVLQELGLRVASEKVAVRFITIDAVEKEPAEN